MTPSSVVTLSSTSICPSKDDSNIISDILESIVAPEAAKAAVVLAQDEEELFHEAGIWMPATKEWIVTSNRLVKSDNEEGGSCSSSTPHVIISAIDREGNVRRLEDLSSQIPMANGGTADGSGGAYLCSQGLKDIGGAIYHTSDDNTKAIAIVDQSSLDINGTAVVLNSPNDICLYQKEWILFTDPSYGYEQGFRTAPTRGEFVWCTSLDGKSYAPLITEGLCKPNGICLSPDQHTLYITDTAYVDGTGQVDARRPRHVLAYDICLKTEDNNNNKQTTSLPIQLSNRRVLFEFRCNQGVPDGIKVDVDGKIYVGAGDGCCIHAPTGEWIGTIVLEGGVANLCFGGDDLRDLLLLNETRAVLIRMKRPGVNLQPIFKS